jgi:hypothetical protein
VAPRLFEHALAGINRMIARSAVGRPGDHVAGVLLVARVSAMMNLRFGVAK